MSVYRNLLGCLLCYTAFCGNTFAGISLDSTRLIFHANSGVHGQTIGVTSSNQSRVPYLVKAQVLQDTQGTNSHTPFSVTPSLFRLEIGATNQIRILKTGNQSLPHDRESLFYLRVMALPSGQKNGEQGVKEQSSSVVVSTGSIIKMFYRPLELPITQQKAMSSLQFSREGNALKVTNSSPYYVTLSSLSVGGKTIDISIQRDNTMVAPFSSLTYQGSGVSGKVTWQAINDFGGVEKFHGNIQ